MRFPFFLLILIPLCYRSVAGVIIVFPSQSLSDEIARAKAGDTIIVKAGHYKPGPLKIRKTLVLMGENWPVLDGENKFEIINVAAERVVISGFKFIDTGVASMEDLSAINGNGAHHIQIINNKIDRAFFGIHLLNTNYAMVRGNVIEGEGNEDETMIGNGIHLWKCSHATIESNTIVGHRDGIYFEFVTQSVVLKNRSEKNIRYGLHFMFSHEDQYIENQFINNGSGVAVMYSHSVTMLGNLFARNWGPSAYGLLLKDIRDSHVESNHFERNTIGIYMEGTSRTEFFRNEFSENGYALRLQASCDDNYFKENNFSSNTFDVATNGSLVLNKMERNYWDRYEGYDLNKDGLGDVAYRPVNLYSMIVEHVPAAVMLWRSFMVILLDHAEKTLPALTPENLLDPNPKMRPYDFLASSH